jgi:hypothetical protein
MSEAIGIRANLLYRVITEGERPVKASSVFGYLLLAAVAAGVLLNIKDIARYIKISTM